MHRMPLSRDDRTSREDFARKYGKPFSRVEGERERLVFGGNFGCDGYTTSAQAAAPVRAKPVRQFGQIPHLPEVAAQLEQAVGVQRQHRAVVIGAGSSRTGLDGVVVGQEGDGAAVGDPLLQFGIASVEGRGGRSAREDTAKLQNSAAHSFLRRDYHRAQWPLRQRHG